MATRSWPKTWPGEEDTHFNMPNIFDIVAEKHGIKQPNIFDRVAEKHNVAAKSPVGVMDFAGPPVPADIDERPVRLPPAGSEMLEATKRALAAPRQPEVGRDIRLEVPRKEKGRSRWAEFVDATARGITRVGSAGAEIGAQVTDAGVTGSKREAAAEL
jgi:hypothetical protein